MAQATTHRWYQGQYCSTWARALWLQDNLGQDLTDLAQRDMPGVILAEGPSMPPLLEVAAREGIQPSFTRQILAKWAEQQEPRSITVPTTGETLTPREVEVLRLIARGASSRAIGELLVIAEPAVKSHVTKILAKVDVSSRTAAVARATAPRLL